MAIASAHLQISGGSRLLGGLWPIGPTDGTDWVPSVSGRVPRLPVRFCHLTRGDVIRAGCLRGPPAPLIPDPPGSSGSASRLRSRRPDRPQGGECRAHAKSGNARCTNSAWPKASLGIALFGHWGSAGCGSRGWKTDGALHEAPPHGHLLAAGILSRRTPSVTHAWSFRRYGRRSRIASRRFSAAGRESTGARSGTVPRRRAYIISG